MKPNKLGVKECEVKMSRRVDLACKLTHEICLSVQILYLFVLSVAHLVNKLIEKQRSYLKVFACHKKCSETGKLHIL